MVEGGTTVFPVQSNSSEQRLSLLRASIGTLSLEMGVSEGNKLGDGLEEFIFPKN